MRRDLCTHKRFAPAANKHRYRAVFACVGQLIKSFDFSFGFCIPNSTNSWEAIYDVPPLDEALSASHPSIGCPPSLPSSLPLAHLPALVPACNVHTSPTLPLRQSLRQLNFVVWLVAATTVQDMVDNPFETQSDSFYFVEDTMIMHNKAKYAYTQPILASA